MLLTREQLQERLIALHQASLELVKDVSLDHLLKRIAEVACEQADARYAAVGVFNAEGGLEKFITVGLTDDQIKLIDHPPVGQGLLGALRDVEEPLRVSVIQDHPSSVGFPAGHPKMISFLGVPIRAGDQQLGQIYLTEKIGVKEFTGDDERIIQMLAAYAFAAIQNARLHENSQRLAVLEERERIGMDLHDGVIQSIYGLGLSLESAFHALDDDPKDAKIRLQRTMDGLNHVIRDIRSYILDLRPRKMGDDGLISGIRRLIAEFRANTLADVQLTTIESDLNNLPQTDAMVLFHICQEALANIAKHAKAKKVQISLWVTDDRILMEIVDDGNGFEMEKMNITIGHGLANMQTRAQSIGGEVDISSMLNEGSTILVWVPRHRVHK
jgi:signal transduction histidine kinase